jgi:murein DD-endopeptidase MepM/ murein hydrolase activator NlpD
MEGKAKRQRDHKGIDLRARLLTPIFASADGIVTFAGFQGKNPSRNQSSNSSQAVKADIDNTDIAGGGIMVFIAHSPSLETRYMHLNSFDIEEGQHVKAGEQIGLSGDSGDAKGGPHLHYEVHQNGKAVDPAPFVFGGQEVA